MFNSFLRREVGFGQSHPVRLRFFMAPYMEIWDLTSLHWWDCDIPWLLIQGTEIWLVLLGETRNLHGSLFGEPELG